MIPRRVITIWVGGPMPQLIAECIHMSQKVFCRDNGYEHILIDNDNYYHCQYVDDAMNAKNYTKAADYLRMHYLYELGGWFLDADTEIKKSFDDVSDAEIVVCREDNGFIANGIVGAIQGHPTIAKYLKSVEDNFKGSGDLVFEPGMELFTNTITYNPQGVRIYPPEWFLPYNHQTGVTNITENTHTYHHYTSFWKK